MSEHESLQMVHNLLHLVPILQRFTPSTPRLRDIPSSGRPASIGCSMGVTLGVTPQEVAKRTSMPPSATSKTSLFGLDSWFRPLDFFNLGRNPICVGCTKFKLITSSTLIPFRGSNTPFLMAKKKAHLSAVRKNRTRIYLSPRFQEGQRLLPVLSHFLLLCFRVDTQLGSND